MMRIIRRWLGLKERPKITALAVHIANASTERSKWCR